MYMELETFDSYKGTRNKWIVLHGVTRGKMAGLKKKIQMAATTRTC